MAPPAVSLFDLLKFLPLFVGKIDRDLLVRFRHDRMDAPSSVAPYLLKLRSRFIDNWRNVGDLFRCQTKRGARRRLRSDAHSPGLVCLKGKTRSRKPPQSSTSDSASDESEHKSGKKLRRYR